MIYTSGLPTSVSRPPIDEVTTGEISCNLIHTTILTGQREAVATCRTAEEQRFMTMIDDFHDWDRMLGVVRFPYLGCLIRICSSRLVCTIELSIASLTCNEFCHQ